MSEKIGEVNRQIVQIIEFPINYRISMFEINSV